MSDPSWISRETLHKIRKYFIEDASAKGFLEDTDCELESGDVQEVLDWFNDKLEDVIENN